MSYQDLPESVRLAIEDNYNQLQLADQINLPLFFSPEVSSRLDEVLGVLRGTSLVDCICGSIFPLAFSLYLAYSLTALKPGIGMVVGGGIIEQTVGEQSIKLQAAIDSESSKLINNYYRRYTDQLKSNDIAQDVMLSSGNLGFFIDGEPLCCFSSKWFF